MATKKIVKRVKARAIAGQATPQPPLGPTLGQAGINIGDFVQKFNAESQAFKGQKVIVHINVYDDRSYDFKVKAPEVSGMLFKTAGIEKGSGKPNTSKVGKISKSKIREIAEMKMVDLNAKDIEGAMKIVEGSARSAGITVE